MADVKPARKHIYEAAAPSLAGVHLKAIDDRDLDRILGGEKGAAASRQPLPITEEIVRKIIQIIKEL